MRRHGQRRGLGQPQTGRLGKHMRQYDPLDNVTLVVGLRFPRPVVMQANETVWIETKVRLERGVRVVGDASATPEPPARETL